MKFLLRVTGTWFLALTAILIVIDGTKSLGTNAIVTTSVADTWASLHIDSWTAANEWIIGGGVPAYGVGAALFVLSWPGWLFAGMLGVVLLIVGRQRMRRNYIQTR